MMRQEQFYRLPRAVQHRFLESTRGVGVPAPIFSVRARSLSHVYWAIAAVAVLLVWLAFAAFGYGNLESSLAIAPSALVLVHVLFAVAVAALALSAQSKSWVAKRTPFLTGTFLFPSGIVSAGLSQLSVITIDQTTDVRVLGRRVDLVIGGKTFHFNAEDEARASAAAQAIQDARQKFVEAKRTGDIRQLLVLDPLQDSGVPNPLAPTEPLAPPVFVKPWLGIAGVVLVGLLLGAGVFWMRNTLSAKALFAAAVERDDTNGYRAYLARGGQRQEVEAILLPRAELADARSKNSVEAIEQYIKEHPKTRIAPDITFAHRQALLKALEQAKQTQKLSALIAIEKKYKGYPLIQAELEAAKQALFDRALQAFKATAAPSPELGPFVQSLARYSRAHGPHVEVRFRPKYVQNYEHIEDVVQRSPYYTGPSLLPGRYFKDKYVIARETRLGQRLVQRLQQGFPSDVLHFTLAGQVDDTAGPLPDVKVPTLFIEHSVTFSGGFVGLKRQGLFMGMTLAYRAAFRMPGQKGEQLVYRIRLWRAPKQELIDQAKDAEELYETLAKDGYDEFAQRYLEYWFKKP